MAQPAHGRDPLVIAVIWDKGYTGLFGRADEEEVCGRNTAMIAIRRQGQLGSFRSGPKLTRHWNRLEGDEALGYLVGTMLIGGKPRQLEDD